MNFWIVLLLLGFGLLLGFVLGVAGSARVMEREKKKREIDAIKFFMMLSDAGRDKQPLPEHDIIAGLREELKKREQ